MSIFLLPLVSLAVIAPADVDGPHAAQVAIVDALSAADAIDSVAPPTAASPHTVTFGFDRDGRAYDLVVTTGFRGAVVDAIAVDVGPARTGEHAGALTWLGAEITDVAAVTTLTVDAGRVVLVTDDERRYLLADRPVVRTANAAVESRWAAAWDAG